MEVSRQLVIEEAVRFTGLDNFGDLVFHEGLEILLAAIGEDRALTEAYRPSVEDKMIGPLAQRLRLYGDRARHPEIAQQQISAPLIVIGLPRSGTTFLQALLSLDPVARKPMAWQLAKLSPPPRQDTLHTDPRIAATDAALAGLPEDFKRMHLVGATLPDECNAITTLGFVSPNFDAGLDVPTYREWFLGADATAAYAVHRHVLQHLQAFTDGAHWVLKAPPHMFHMAALIATYPDARIVLPHRDPAETIPSLASLIACVRGFTYADVDRPGIARAQLEFWATGLERALAFRDDPAQAHRFFDVSYDDIIARPIETVMAIYSYFGLHFTPAAETAMRGFIAEKPKDKQGPHRYSLEEFGLTREAVHRRFGRYVDSRLVALK